METKSSRNLALEFTKIALADAKMTARQTQALVETMGKKGILLVSKEEWDSLTAPKNQTTTNQTTTNQTTEMTERETQPIPTPTKKEMETTSERLHPVRQVANLAAYLRDHFPDVAPRLDSGEPSPAELAIELLSQGDMLEQMWQAQTELNTTTFASNPDRCTDAGGSPISFDRLLYMANHVKDGAVGEIQTRSGKSTSYEGAVEKWLTGYCTAMLQEIAELRDSTNWKWWRSKVDKFDLQNIWVELVDILHFWMSACMVAGLSPRDVFKMYKEKNKVNFQRQESGYLAKDENDSRHLAPE